MTIKRRELQKKAGAGAGLATLSACAGGEETGAVADGGVSGPRVEWRLATSYPPSVDILYGATERLAAHVSAATGGNFTIRVYAPGEIVPALQVMDSVMQGTTQCGFSPGYYYTGKHPAFAFDTTIPFGFDPRQQVAWLSHGGGLGLINSIYAEFGLITFPMGNTGGQMGGWFREPVGGLSDLTGLRMRIPGIGGEIMSRLG
ncbi:MAG: ABC transporter substrate-binding protein, partial [Gemmatimonadetes bacterium]|nr:ABC transporter substrate-binding protein [Gemmatimonadota bacterium]